MKHLVLSAVLIFASLANAAEKVPPSTAIHGTAAQVKDSIMSVLARDGWQVATDGAYQLTVRKNVTGAAGAMTKALMGNAYSNQPYEVLTFTFAPSSQDTLVTLRDEVVVEMPFGRVNRTELNDKKHQSGQMSFLARIKTSVEHSAANGGIYLGVGMVRTSTLIETIKPGSPAEKAGLKAGDILIAIDDAKMSSADQVVSEIAKHALGDSVKIRFVRNGDTAEVLATLEKAL